MTKTLVFLGLVGVLIANLGCQPPRKDKKERIGRGRSGVTGNFDANHSNSSAGIDSNKRWGEITSRASTRTWEEAIYYFTLPSVRDLGEDDQVGRVSPRSGDSTGVRFYGNALTNGSGGSVRSFDPASMMIHIEVYDDRTGEEKSGGGKRAPIVVEISPKISGFVEAGGRIDGNQVELYFIDKMGGVLMNGEIVDENFVGTVEFTDESGRERMELGEFSVPACGFFKCQQ